MKIVLLASVLIINLYSFGQIDDEFEYNFEESKVPEFEIPAPLRTFKGEIIKNEKNWEKRRRPELLTFFKENVYGKVPGKLEMSSYEILEESDNALNGKAHRKQVTLNFKKNNHTLNFTILLYLPTNIKNAPVFLGYNFFGNHTITNDINVIISEAWTRNNPSLGIESNQLTEKSRGVSVNRWPVEKIIDAGFGLATIFYGEVDPDRNDFSDGAHPLFYKDNQQEPAADEWGSISAWAWGLSRVMDYFEMDNDVDEENVIVFGHSRLGKTSLWAGATDTRFAAVISNNSGCGGAALSKRKFGETLDAINNYFPHWFCKKFSKFNNNEEALPVDQHELIALIAPRPVYIASAEEDLWADPQGEFLSAYYATPVYELYGKKGILTIEMPELNNPIQNTVAYHIRSGGHDVTDYDWEQYLKWATAQLKTGDK